MGMYKRIEYMRLNGFLDNQTTESGQILPCTELVFVYRLTHEPSGHYYIGQTKDIKERMHFHFTEIIKSMNGTQKIRQHVHSIISNENSKYLRAVTKALEAKNKKPPKTEGFLRDSLSVYILGIAAEPHAANSLEKYYIQKNIDDALCLNKRDW